MKKYTAVENEVIPTRESDFFNLAINSISPVKALLQRNPEKIMLWEGHEKKLADEKIKSDFIEKLENLQYEGKPVVQMNITSISPNMYTTTEVKLILVIKGKFDEEEDNRTFLLSCEYLEGGVELEFYYMEHTVT